MKKEEKIQAIESVINGFADMDGNIKAFKVKRIAERLVENCNLAFVTTRFSANEIDNVMRKVKKATISPYFKQILQRATGDSYDSKDDKAFLDKYTGKVTNVYEWAGDWWIAEDDNYVITEDCFTIL